MLNFSLLLCAVGLCVRRALKGAFSRLPSRRLLYVIIAHHGHRGCARFHVYEGKSPAIFGTSIITSFRQQFSGMIDPGGFAGRTGKMDRICPTSHFHDDRARDVFPALDLSDLAVIYARY